MKIKLGNVISNNLHINSVIKPKIFLNQRKKNLLISPKLISVSIRTNVNNINVRRKERKKSKNIFHNMLSNEDNKNYYTLNNENYNKNNLKKFLDTNDYNTLKKNLEVVKFELNILNKKINNNKISLEKLMKNLSDINAGEIEQKKMLQDYVSKNKNLEEMKKSLINKIKNKNKSSDTNENYNDNVNITLEELLINKKESFIEQVFQIFNEINNINNKKYYNIYKIIIEKSYLELISDLKNQSLNKNNNLVNNFFFRISRLTSQSNFNEKDINILLSVLVKKNIISDKINKIISSFDSNYKNKNTECNKKIKEIKNKLNLLKITQNELMELKNKIIEKIEKEKKYSPFGGRIIKQKSFNKNNILNVSSSFNFSTEFINKINSNNFNNNKSLNNISNKTERKSIDKKKINLIKNINSKTKSGKYNSNRISVNKIDLKGIFQSFKENKEKLFENSINNVKTERGIYINKIQNGLASNYRRNKVITLTRDNGRTNNNLTKSYNELNLNKINRFNTNSNKKIFSKRNIFNSKDKSCNNLSILNINNYIKGKLKRTKTEKVQGLLLKDEINNKIKEKRKINDNINSVFRKRNILSINSSFLYKKKIKSINFKKWNNQLNKDQRIKSSEKRTKVNKRTKLIIEPLDESLVFRKRENSLMSYKIINNLNSYKIQLDNAIKSFCYFKYLDKNSSMFNPLENNIDFKNSEYNEGLIYIDNSTDSIKIGQIHTSQNDTISLTNSQSIFNYSNGGLDIINIEFNNITNVYMNELMKNIVKIHDKFIKYNTSKDKEKAIKNKNAPLNINKFLKEREIMFINDLSREEKIKASLCNFFSLILEYNNFHEIELIFINFNQFNIWYNYLKDILKNNKKEINLISNGISNSNKKVGVLLHKFKGNNINNYQ